MTGTTSQGGKPPGNPPQKTARNSQGLLLCYARWSRAIVFETQGARGIEPKTFRRRGQLGVAAAMLTCLANHMPGIIDHAWVHDRLLALVPSEFRARLKATKSTTRTPQTLFALARQAFQDKHAELTITLAAPTYAASFKQPADRSFEQHLEACVKVYRSHYIREPLTPARYVERFGPAHRLGPLSTVFLL